MRAPKQPKSLPRPLTVGDAMAVTEEAGAFAADAWIDKPFDLRELRQKIAELGEASLLDNAAPAPSGPSIKKARPSSDMNIVADDDEAEASHSALCSCTGLNQNDYGSIQSHQSWAPMLPRSL